jgi:hypothetical protein
MGKSPSIEDALFSQWKKAAFSRDIKSLDAALSQINSAPLTHCDKSKVFGRILENAVSKSNPFLINIVISHIANAKSLTEWDRSLAIKSGLIRAIERNNGNAISYIIACVPDYKDRFDSSSLTQILSQALKKAMEAHNKPLCELILSEAQKSQFYRTGFSFIRSQYR